MVCECHIKPESSIRCVSTGHRVGQCSSIRYVSTAHRASTVQRIALCADTTGKTRATSASTTLLRCY
eukprot:3296062-Rhodomonas_salina.1